MELYPAGTRGWKRDLIIDLETRALTPDKGEIIRYRAINHWDEDDLFDEWAWPLVTLLPEVGQALGIAKE